MVEDQFELDPRYIVLKRKDVLEYLSMEERVQLARLTTKIYDCREEEGRQELACVVVESDWPEYMPTVLALKERIHGAASLSTTG